MKSFTAVPSRRNSGLETMSTSLLWRRLSQEGFRMSREDGAAYGDDQAFCPGAKEDRDVIADPAQIAEVDVSIRLRGCADTKHHDICRIKGLFIEWPGLEPPFGNISLDKAVQTDFEKRRLRLPNRFHFMLSRSTPSTLCPISAKHAALTQPTYPRPITITFCLLFMPFNPTSHEGVYH